MRSFCSTGVPHTQGAQAWKQFYTNACLYLVSIHQMLVSLISANR